MNTTYRMTAHRDNGPTVSTFIRFFSTEIAARAYAAERKLKIARIVKVA
jgi:hypothetical protein